MDLSIFFAGTGGSVPTARRGLPAVLVRRSGEKLLFDCGEGTQRQLLKSVGLADLDAVFITHFHADHWLGLPGMLKSLALRGREEPLVVNGPPGLESLMASMRAAVGTLAYELRLVELEPWEELDRDGYRIAAVPVNHGDRAAYGYVLLEHDRPGEFDPAAARELGIEDVRDYGRLQRGETVGGVRPEQVLGEPRRGRKVVLSGDTAPAQTLAVAAHGADVLIHEATFAEEDAARARETSHSTARQAGLIAKEAEVGMLALTHISTRYPASELREEARAVFPATEAPRDFDTIDVPFPERGPATLERWSDRQARERRSAAEGGPQADPSQASGGVDTETIASP